MYLTSRDYGKESGQKNSGKKSSEEDLDLNSEEGYCIHCEEDSKEGYGPHRKEGYDFQGQSSQDCPPRTQVGGQGFCHKAPEQRVLAASGRIRFKRLDMLVKPLYRNYKFYTQFS
jgi:hypothetical protein